MARKSTERGFYMTQEEIASVFNVSQKRINQIEKSALAKCRRHCAIHGLNIDDLIPGASLLKHSPIADL